MFFDENAIQYPDPDHSQDEDRFLMVGRSYKFRTLIVCHCYRENEFEIRHLAVDKSYQHKSIGTNLISRLFESMQKDCHVRIQAYVRNESYPFFVKQGFVPVNDEWLEHPDFTKYGIRFKLVEKYV